MKEALLVFLFALGFAALADKSHYILQITDQHLEWEYHEGTDPSQDWCRSNVPGTAGHYGDFGCHSPMALLQAQLVDCRTRFPNPDFIFWTGDMRRGFATVNGDKEVILALWNMTVLLRSVYPGVPVFPVLGNHDVHPNNLHGAERAPLYTNIAAIWPDYLGSEAQKTFGEGGYYVRHMDGYSVIVLNSCMYYNGDTMTADQDDPAGQLAWLQSVFTSFPNERFYVLGHCPIMYDNMHDNQREMLLSIVRKYHSQIEALFMGHFHIDITSLVFDSTGNTPLFLQYSAPSVATRPGGVHGGHNPAYRVYYRHVENGVPQMLLDSHETYYLPLEQANKARNGTFYFEYGSNDGKFPGLDIPPPITADKWYKAINTAFQNSTLIYELYSRYNVRTLNPGDACDGSCAKTLRCKHLYFADKTQFNKCKN